MLSKKLVILGSIIIFPLLAILIFPMTGCAEKMMYFPPKASYADEPEVIKIPVNRDETISAVYLDGSPEGYTLLFSHGNAEDIGQNLPFFRQCQRNGFGVFAYDYRGYGTSDGKPTEQNTYQDIDAAYAYLIETLNIPADRVLVHGRSIGSGPACYLATRKPVAGLILESAFTSAYRVALGFSLPFDPYDNLSRFKNVRCPVLMIHGQQDRVVPFRHGQTLYDVVSEPKMKYWVPDAGHNDLFYKAGKNYWKTLHEFEKLLQRTQIERRSKC
ncbi:MAG: alpha/beta hydrolase [Planctomycetota bacterium]